MPKIVINEYDLTKAGTGEYANFSVVVPGLLGKGKSLKELQAAQIFDENGIYECSSQSDFVENVGKTYGTVSMTVEKAPAKAPKLYAKIVLAEDAVDTTPDDAEATYKIVKEEDNSYTITWLYKDAYANCLKSCLTGYLPTFTDAEDAPSDYAPAGSTSKDFDVYTASKNYAGVGVLADLDNVYKTATWTDILEAADYSKAVESDGVLNLDNVGDISLADAAEDAYYIIKSSDIGSKATTDKADVPHSGNQIAYELLGLGYTILYKAIEETDDIGAGKFWDALKDKSTYDFRYVVTGLMTKNAMANAAIISLCEWKNKDLDDADAIKDGRGDCFALVDLDLSTALEAKATTQSAIIPYIADEANKFASAYAACFAPSVTYTMVEDKAFNKNTTFPGSFHYLACAANSASNNYNEWYANAGYTRGVAKYTIKSLGCKLGDMAVQALQPRFGIVAGTLTEGGVTRKVVTNVAVNLIIKIKNSYYLWGNRTAKKLGTRYASDGDLVAQHFLNIRQLCTTIKKQVYVTCRRLTYDPNSNNLWINFRALLTPMLEKMKADQGIRDYEFVKDATDRKALLKASIRIVPIEAVEDFEIGLYLEDSLTEASVSEA